MHIWTIGHSNHPLSVFIDMLTAHGIHTVADIRSIPGSRKYPWFNSGPLSATLRAADIEYESLRELGGRRRPSRQSVNTAWRNASFRGYADYMQTPEFHAGIERLLALAAAHATVIMCAEALWWRCHRALVSDYLKARGVQVWHILSAAKTQEHPYTSAARIVHGVLTYPGDAK